jgi:glycosyltransferase involved in cell wall biosynthesis
MRDLLPRPVHRRVRVLPQPVADAFFAARAPRDASFVLFLGQRSRATKRFWLAQSALSRFPGLTLKSLDDFAPSQIPLAMARARLGVLTSSSEGLPVACREALTTGLPAVVTDLPGTRELAEQVPEGVLLCSGELTSVVSALEQGLSVTEGTNGLTLEARLRDRIADLGWDVDSHLRRLLEIYGVS